MKLPIFNNRELIGYACSIVGAKRVITKAMDITRPFSVSVWRRSETMQDILQLPDGYVYSVSYGAK